MSPALLHPQPHGLQVGETVVSQFVEAGGEVMV
jgi:hypothetical protein